MTTPTTPPAITVDVSPNSRLEQLLSEYDAAKAAADAMRERLDMVTTAIKAELALAAPGRARIEVASEHLEHPLRMQWVEKWRIDSKRLKAEDPETYVRYATKGGNWELRRVT